MFNVEIEVCSGKKKTVFRTCSKKPLFFYLNVFLKKKNSTEPFLFAENNAI